MARSRPSRGYKSSPNKVRENRHNHRKNSSSAPKRQETTHHRWLYGIHAVYAALENPVRFFERLVVTAENHPALTQKIAQISSLHDSEIRKHYPDIEIMGRQDLTNLLPEGAVHQGLACLPRPLPETSIEDLAPAISTHTQARVLVLDHVTDPRNVGAILRSAAAFGVSALILQDRHAPPVTGALAKAASGALELVPMIHVVNLARALDQLKQWDFWCLGLDGQATQTLAEAAPKGRIAFVLGAEGEGLRRLTRDHCDLLVKLPIRPEIESLNVSNAAAISLYELARDLPGTPS